MALYEIIYVSLASRDLPAEELAQLLDKAVRTTPRKASPA
jgi:hypothetical protein